jgi:hypothetical protein
LSMAMILKQATTDQPREHDMPPLLVKPKTHFQKTP